MPASRETNVPTAPARRVVLLGASNLTKGIGTVLETAGRVWNEPLEVHTALGHGRSYGRRTQVMAVGLPGIEACGLWPALAALQPLPTAALVTDIGNDILYDEPLDRIVGWLEACLDRLADAGAQTTITRLPIANLEKISQLRFQVARRILYPFSGLSLMEVRRRAVALDECVARLAAQRGLAVVEQRPHWYSFDPVHIRFARRGEAWRDILGAWISDGNMLAPGGNALFRTFHLRTLTPHERRLLFIAQRGAQPAARFRDGTSVSIY